MEYLWLSIVLILVKTGFEGDFIREYNILRGGTPALVKVVTVSLRLESILLWVGWVEGS